MFPSSSLPSVFNVATHDIVESWYQSSLPFQVTTSPEQLLLTPFSDVRCQVWYRRGAIQNVSSGLVRLHRNSYLGRKSKLPVAVSLPEYARQSWRRGVSISAHDTSLTVLGRRSMSNARFIQLCLNLRNRRQDHCQEAGGGRRAVTSCSIVVITRLQPFLHACGQSCSWSCSVLLQGSKAQVVRSAAKSTSAYTTVYKVPLYVQLVQTSWNCTKIHSVVTNIL